MTAALRLQGDTALISALNRLPVRVERKVLTLAIRAAIRPVVTAAKRNARKLGRFRGQTGRDKHGRFTGESRAAKRARREKGDFRLGETIEAVLREYPGVKLAVAGPVYGSKYGYKGNIGHLVERGHRKVLWGKRTGGRVPAYRYLKPAWDAQVATAQAKLEEKIRTGIEREAAKLRKR